uniref:ligand-dependent nuclear receptor corepressor-like protein isoform X2 n=1 Tax=Myxine glutinosa TaxID=7769 RepID=UPI00358F7445
MASRCRSPRCSAERRGFRRELESWRYKLLQCVGFETILEGLYGPGLLRDLTLFDECEAEEALDWSMDENCPFCCLRRDKVKEHLASPAGSDDATDSTDAAEQFERETETFLHALFQRKEFPRACNPAIPLVAREIMYRMIRQFAAEYAHRQDPAPDKERESSRGTLTERLDRAFIPHPSTLGKGTVENNSAADEELPAHPQPGDDSILGLLLTENEDAPLDLSVGKGPVRPCKYDDAGALDLSTKKAALQFQQFLHTDSAKPTMSKLQSKMSGECTAAGEERWKGCEDGHAGGLGGGDQGRKNQHDPAQPTALLVPQMHPVHEGASSLSRLDPGPWISTPLQCEEAKLSMVSSTSESMDFIGKVGVDDASKLSSSGFLQQLAMKRLATQTMQDGLLGGVQLRIPQIRSSTATTQFEASAVELECAAPTTHLSSASLALSSTLSMDGPSHAGRKLKAILPKQQPLLPQHLGEASLIAIANGKASDPISTRVPGKFVGITSLTITGDSSEPKAPRRKRGRYRQYDNNILEEAIAMVMSGRMSVSKAQALYGIPHSTLEYKVKERAGTLKTPPKRRRFEGESALSEATPANENLTTTSLAASVTGGSTAASSDSEGAGLNGRE